MKGILLGLTLMALLCSGCSAARPKSTFRLQTQPGAIAANERQSAPPAAAPLTDWRTNEPQTDKTRDDTPKVALDAFGHPIPLYVKATLHYNGATPTIDRRQAERIDKIGTLLRDNPGSQALIAGHSDGLGDEQLARLNSEQRAQVVKQAIIKKYGVAPERLQIIALGKLQPLASNATESGRQRNRRVEVTLTGYYSATSAGMRAAKPPVAGRAVTLNYKSGEIETGARFLAELDALGAYLSSHPEAVAAIDGYTDSKGSAQINLQLSQRRADAVKNYLALRHNISIDRLKSASHGVAAPVASNETDAGRQKNRRVVISLSQHNDGALAAKNGPANQPNDAAPVKTALSAPAPAAASNVTPPLPQQKTSAASQATTHSPQYLSPGIEIPRKRTRFIGELSVSEQNATLPKTSLPSNVAIRFSGTNSIPEQASLPALDALGQALKANPKAKIVIESHSDSTGNKDTNGTIARERGEYVMNYLISMYEISPDRIRMFTFSADAPLAFNETGAGSRDNKRVEIKVNP